MSDTLCKARELFTTCMKFTIDTVNRANARTIARSTHTELSEEDCAVMADGSIEVSTMYQGKRYSQRLTPEQLNEAFGKALSSYGKEI